MLLEQIRNRQGGMLIYGITPPKSNKTDEAIAGIAGRQMSRIKALPIDGLIVYDLQDETERTKEERPFEFISTVDPSLYSGKFLKELDVPRIVYRCVGNYKPEPFVEWLESGKDLMTVFVGTAAESQRVNLSLAEAYELRQKHNTDVTLGAVTIPERHLTLGDEDQRVGFKMRQGCSFFVSQAVYDVEASKKFLRDYKAYCKAHQISPVPIIFTLTPCGSAKTLKFIKWLGIQVPGWLEESLMTSDDMLDRSMELLEGIYKELTAFGHELEIPVGFNVESVSIRKVEIEASVALVKALDALRRG